jgi:hypothetical protein
MLPDDLAMVSRMDRRLLELLNAAAEDSSCSHLLFQQRSSAKPRVFLAPSRDVFGVPAIEPHLFDMLTLVFKHGA